MVQEKLKVDFEQVATSSPVEQMATQEQATEQPSQSVDDPAVFIEQKIANTITTIPVSSNQPIAPKLTPRQLAIDDILEDGLVDIYLQLSKEDQVKLKTVGEQTVQQIDQLLDKAKVNFKKIMDLVRRFLATIPGINRFFLEQEAKIKTDKIIVLKNR